ncbi:MAG: hypothetical protein LBO03_04360 [Acidaminococcales bacterium]|jgi:hypothetical protein|nr:hypothetical protein [Acidaminococcales bacterium]
MITISKVKHNKEGVYIEYADFIPRLPRKGESAALAWLTLKCPEPPAPPFLAALQALAEDTAEICELPGDYAARIKVSGLTIKRGEGGTKVVITAQMELYNSDAPLNLNTPLTEAPIGSALETKMNAVCHEAELYIQGERLQASLFPPEADEDEEAAGALH